MGKYLRHSIKLYTYIQKHTVNSSTLGKIKKAAGRMVSRVTEKELSHKGAIYEFYIK